LVRAGGKLPLPLGSLPDYHAPVVKSIRDNAETRKRRPRQTGEMIGTRLQPDLLKLVDDWRREQPDLPTRPEAIRRLILKALKGG
jgi:hypothetical protein